LSGPAIWLLSSNLAYVGFQWAAVMALAKLGAPVALGHVGLALAIVTPVVLITGFALRTYQATDVLRRYAFAEYLNLRLVANLVAAAVIAAATALARVEEAAVVILVPIAGAKLAEATCETCYGLAQRHDRMRFVALSRVARGGLGFAALVAVVALGGTLASGCWALAAAWVLFLLVVDLPVAGTLEPVLQRPRVSTLSQLAWESAPLGGVTGVFSIAQSVPRYVLQLTHGAAAVGYFTGLSSFIPVLGQLATSVSQAAAPRLGWNATGDGARYRTLVLRLLGAGAVAMALMTLGAVLLGRPFLRLAYTEEYAAYHATFVVIMVAAALGMMNEVLYVALVAARRLRVQLGIQCFGLAVTILVSAVLIPRLGVGGAAVALAVAAGATAAVSACLVLAR
jgi:O-antigen/teichoic acid export membrane protein